MQTYSDQDRADIDTALPDVEVFYIDRETDPDFAKEDSAFVNDDGEYLGDGWYYWSCFPGCLPDSMPYGPFSSEEQALADMRETFASE